MKSNHPLAIAIALLYTCIIFSQAPKDIFNYELLDYQKTIVGKLTGNLPIKGRKKITTRGTPNTRKITSEYLYDELTKLGLEVFKQNYSVQDKSNNKYKGINVYARLPALHVTDEYIILCSNYDTAKESPGAIHNATAIAGIYSVAKSLLQLKKDQKTFCSCF